MSISKFGIIESQLDNKSIIVGSNTLENIKFYSNSLQSSELEINDNIQSDYINRKFKYYITNGTNLSLNSFYKKGSSFNQLFNFDADGKANTQSPQILNLSIDESGNLSSSEHNKIEYNDEIKNILALTEDTIESGSITVKTMKESNNLPLSNTKQEIFFNDLISGFSFSRTPLVNPESYIIIKDLTQQIFNEKPDVYDNALIDFNLTEIPSTLFSSEKNEAIEALANEYAL